MEQGFIKVNGVNIEFPKNVIMIDKQLLGVMLNPNVEDTWDGITEVCIPDTVRVIAKNSFSFFKNLRSVFLSNNNNLSYIEDGAFAYCKALHYFEFENCYKMKMIDKRAFLETELNYRDLEKIPFKDEVFISEKTFSR